MSGLNSVNCQTTNTTPSRNGHRLVVGSRVEVQGRVEKLFFTEPLQTGSEWKLSTLGKGQGTILANDTTIMPDINGIAELMVR